ncbi:phosphate acetyltransferase [Facklamia miroungae]|uniref:Phosphate acetyltransferase n=1 Tax=Facklamia miroungae TaxID=120956 RepID=A0A1G7RIB6_9LACT|nr:phosphate acetyltransferase [Facklamia miroungae]NKZ29404.1 phosphate acetyltransferase [Facklamia miroungae]SDG10462.1 phosphate acetyltransferase [Facklamia miroungae]
MFQQLQDNIKGKNISIVFPEGNDARVLGAAVRLHAEDIVKPIVLGNEKEIRKLAEEKNWVIEGITIHDPSNYAKMDELVEAFVERRKGKNTREQAVEMLKDPAYFGTMLVYTGEADGMVCGAVYSTSDTVRPALQIIKTRPGVNLISGAFIMVPPHTNGQKLVFADCAININPDSQSLAEIAVESAKTAKIFGIDPKVAMLSFSSHGSAKSPEVDKVAEATKMAKELAPELIIDGEIQFDAAIVPEVAAQKVPGSILDGQATVFVFPEIQSGNIGYKIAQRLGNFQAVGPILQGLNKPVSDLSRGCVEEDVFKVAIITANQVIG